MVFKELIVTVVSTAVIQNMVDIKWKVNKCCHQNHFCIPVNIISLPDALNFYISPDTKAVYDICRLQTADCMRQQDCKLNETKSIVIKVASSSTLPCSEKYM